MNRVKGLNDKEQRLLNKFADGEPHDFREMKKLFWKDATDHCDIVYAKGWGDHEVNTQAQSYARNSIRRLIRDGWVAQSGRGTYKITRAGSLRVTKGTDTTPSFSGRARRGEGKKAKAAAAKPKNKPGRPPKAKVETASAEPKRKPGRPRKVKTESAPVKEKKKPGRPAKAKVKVETPDKTKLVKLRSKVTQESGQVKASKAAAAIAAALVEDTAVN